MVVRDWYEAVTLLAKATRLATPRQIEIAALVGVSIAPDTPAIVAAAQLRNAIAPDLQIRVQQTVRDESLEWIQQLWPGKGAPPTPTTQEEVNGWIEYLLLVKRKDALVLLRPSAGDIVATAGGDLAEVSSIGNNGRLYFKGGGGFGAWPDQVSMVASASDESATAADARTRARNAASLRRPTSSWSLARQEDLREFRVDDFITTGQLLQLESVIDAA